MSRTTHHVNEPSGELPSVDVVIVNSRGKANPWFTAAKQSAEAQSYPRTGVLVIDNNDHGLTIGAAYNLAASSSDADLLLFLGDDDTITIDLVSSLVSFYQFFAQQPDVNPVHVTSFCTLLFDKYARTAPASVVHTGMYLRSFLLENPFDEQLTKGIGIELNNRLQRIQQREGLPVSFGILHHYGYVFRQHIGMVNGQVAHMEPNLRNA